ncbi:MAG TPA: hypothetical protein P5167_05980, partial [Bacteroidales bacterium]|nr:hypothetical protein [Bacteroidales bacterium]
IRIKTNRRSASKPTVDPHQNQLHIRIKTGSRSAAKLAIEFNAPNCLFEITLLFAACFAARN